MHSYTIKLTHKNGVSFQTRKEQAPAYTLIFVFSKFLPPLFSVSHSSEKTGEKSKQTRQDPKLTGQCRQPCKDQTLSPNMIHNPR